VLAGKRKLLLIAILIAAAISSRLLPEIRKVRTANEILAQGVTANGVVDSIERSRKGFDLYYHYSEKGVLYSGHDWCHYYRQWWLSMPKPGDNIRIRIDSDSPQFSLSTYSVYFGPGRYGLLAVGAGLLLFAVAIVMVCLSPSRWSRKTRLGLHKMDQHSWSKIKDKALRNALEKADKLGGKVLGWGPDIVIQYRSSVMKEQLTSELTKDGWFPREDEGDVMLDIVTFTRTR
jgi:hypothetical protein